MLLLFHGMPMIWPVMQMIRLYFRCIFRDIIDVGWPVETGRKAGRMKKRKKKWKIFYHGKLVYVAGQAAKSQEGGVMYLSAANSSF